MHHLNDPARPRAADPFATRDYEDLAAFYTRHPALEPTPLRALPAMAAALGIRALHVKDESSRFGLNAFKSLGVRYAVDRLRREGRIGANATLVCASAGNHGRAVARVARDHGFPARVYMSSVTRPAQREAIAGEGATVVVVEGSYEEAVHRMAHEAGAHGWTIISDTSWDGYEEIPRLIMLGYTHMVNEIGAQLADRPDVVFVQGGVGGLVFGVAAGLLRTWRDGRPRLVACEPANAACLLASAQAGRFTTLSGPLETIMSGLRCAEPSPAAWPLIAALADAFVAVDDDEVRTAMRMLARPMGDDPAIEAGPSGACSFASLVAVMRDPAFRPVQAALGLGPGSRVVAINTEGATDRALWDSVLAQP